MNNGLLRQINHLIGKAISTYNMIKDGDRIIVAVSGGKDSLTLLWFLKERLKWIPVNYEILAVHIDLGFNSSKRLEAFFKENGISYEIIKTEIKPNNTKNFCFFCSRQRKRLLFELADRLGFSKIAYGHHKDDVIETLFMNIFYSANISTMLPVQEFFDGRFQIIRPLYLVDEVLIKRFSKAMGWDKIGNQCPFSLSKRTEIKDMLQRLYKSNKKIKPNIFHAIHNIRPDYLPHKWRPL